MIHPAVVLVAAHLTQPAAMPQLNVEPSCHAVADMNLADGQSFIDCMRDETEAKNQVAKSWGSYTPAARRRCSEETMIEGSPSYVELYTCLDIAKSLSQHPEANADRQSHRQ